MLNYMSDSVFERVSKIVELMDMNGNTKEYQEKAKRLDPEELVALKKLKARHALKQHRAKKHTGTTRTNTNRKHTTACDDNMSTVVDATTTAPQTRAIEDFDTSDTHEDECRVPLASSVEQEQRTHQQTAEYLNISCDAPEEPQDIATVDYFDISCDTTAHEEPQDIPTINLQYKEREVDGIALRSTFRKTLATYNRLGMLEDKFPDNGAIAMARRDTLTNLMSLGQVAKDSNLSEDEPFYPEEPTTRKRRHKRMHRRRQQ